MPAMKNTAILAAALAVSSTEGFVGPALNAPAMRTSAMTMKADGSNNVVQKASAAAVIAGMLFSNAVAPPAQAAIFTQEPTQQVSVGFGQPKVDKDPMNNNAASGRTNDNKYDAVQQGSFAKKFAAGNAADYGSAKGTDFGDTAGSSPGAATQDTATAGKFQADAEKPQNQGIVDIAQKKTSDAANVDIKDVAKGGNTLLDSIKETAKGAVGAQTAQAPTWGDAKGAAKQAGRELKNSVSSTGSSSTLLATGPLSVQDPAGFRFGIVPNSPNPAKAAGAASEGPKQLINNVKDATQGKGSAAKAVAENAKAGSSNNNVEGSGVDISSRIGSGTPGDKTLDRAANAASTAASKAEQGVKGAASNTIVSGLFDNAGTEKAKAAANSGKSAVVGKVGSDVEALKQAKPTAEGQSIMSRDASSAASQSGQKTVDKVKSDIGAVDQLRKNPPFQQSSASSVISAGLLDGTGVNPNADKVIKENTQQVKDGINALRDAKPSASGESIMSKDAAGAASKTGQKTVDKVKSDIGAADNARKSAGASNNILSSLFDNKVESAAKGANEKLKDAKPTPKGESIMSRDASSAASQTGAKTVDKVKSDIDSVNSGVPSYGGDIKGAASGAASDIKGAAQDLASKAKNAIN